jgi:hypothetical protein
MFIGLNQSMDTLHFATGAHLFFHNHTERPHSSQSIDVPVGMVTSISVERNVISKLGRPYSNCISDEHILKTKKFYNVLVRDGFSYKQSDCVDLCMLFYLNKYKKVLL